MHTIPFPRMIAALLPLLAPDWVLHRATGRPVDVLWQTGANPVLDGALLNRCFS
ncbi:hypothetical protein AB0H34_38780 [Saccharopolyspora shandongensis]|uniref:hypothetical protein n=1 Tax=Saccharopolyspora shandongensis TaxID=418495 RepID=UPI0033DE2142